MLKRKKQEEEAASKPRFLTKEERARLAIEKREKEIQAKKAQEKEKLEVIRKSHSPASQNDSSSPRNGANGHHRNDSPDSSSDSKRTYDDSLQDSEFASVRARYMGITQPKVKKRRANDRKVVFDWNPESDTSKPETETQDASKPVSIGFGRGHLGGYTGTSKSRAALDRHWSEKELIEMTERDWRIFREDYNISTKGGSVPAPLRNWDEANFPPVLLNVIREVVGYKEPTPIQRQAIPIGLKCRDLIGIAETGSGKTAAFILPILVYIQSLPPITDFSRNDGPYAIVLAPTRELAQQIESEAHKFATPMGFRAVSIVGGHSIEEQAWKLTNGAEIVIATPGRLVDCLDRHVLVLSQCNYVVMDEADRMIDLGFEDQVERVLDALPLSNVKPDTEDAENPSLMSRMLRLGNLNKELRYRNTVMFSATMPPALERIARKYMRRPATVIIGNAGQAVDSVEQRVIMVGQDEQKRKNKLLEILSSGDQTGPIIVFVREKRMCDTVAKDLSKIGWKTVTLHGGKSQETREAALNALREGRADCLVATDLAGRGIDVPNVKLVLNYHMAKSIEDYVHRIGRTGRAGKKGLAITFLGPEDTDLYYDLKQQLSKSSLSQVPEELKNHEAARRRPEQAKSGNTATENRFASLLGDRQLPPGFEALGATQAATSRYTPSPLVLPRGYRHT